MSRTPQARWMMRLMVLLNPSSGPIGLLTLQAFKAAGGTRAVCVDGIAKRRDRAASAALKDSRARPTGIAVIGDVPWGTHFCQFYQTRQDLVEILVPYFKAGLENNEFCMWVTSEPLRTDEAKAALRAAVPDLDRYVQAGQIEVLDYTQWYTRSGEFRSDEVLQARLFVAGQRSVWVCGARLTHRKPTRPRASRPKQVST